jgi:general secretion pathway protein A
MIGSLTPKMDYLDYFGFDIEPFTPAPLPRFYFASEQHSRALQRLEYSVSRMQGLALLVGEIGRGKSTLARRLLDALPPKEFEAALLVIIHAGITPSWLVKRIAMQLGVKEPVDEKTGLMTQLYQRLVEIKKEGRKAVVLVDEAQMLNSREIMEEFRGMLNLEEPGRKLISFVFFGMPSLDQRLALDPPLAQRVAMRCTLESLNVQDTTTYITHRLKLAGADTELFNPACTEEVHRWTGGVPRLINTVCDNILLELYLRKEHCATVDLIMEVADNLALEPLPRPENVSQEQPRLSESMLAIDGGPGADSIMSVARTQAPEKMAPLEDGIAQKTSAHISLPPQAAPTHEVPKLDIPKLDIPKLDIEDPLAFLTPPTPPAAPLESDNSKTSLDEAAFEDLDIDIKTTSAQIPSKLDEQGTGIADDSTFVPLLGLESSEEHDADDLNLDIDIDLEDDVVLPATLPESASSANVAQDATTQRRRRRVTTSSGRVIDLSKFDDLLADLD